MAGRLCWLWLLAGLFSTMQALPGFAETIDLSPVFKDVDSAATRMRQKDVQVGARLDRDIDILSHALGDDSIPDEASVLVHYYRALALFYRNEFDSATGRKYDTRRSSEALAEFNGVVATLDKKYQGGGGDLKGNALYYSGGLAYAQLNDEALAYRYWTACAGVDHAGCLNIIALASTTGDGGRPVDLAEAMRMYKRVFQSTADFGCAGVHAAYSIAMLLALGGVKDSKENPEIWIENAGNLLNVVEADQPNDDRCGRAGIQLSRYLILLSRGKKQPEILDQVLARPSAKPGDDVAAYLKGTLDSDAFQAKVSDYPDNVKCMAYFYALWAADIAKNAARAKQYQSLLGASRDVTCRADAVYTRSLRALQ